MKYVVKKLFNGFASVRDSSINFCLKKNEDLIIIYQGKEMLISIEILKDPDKFQIHKTMFKSKFKKGENYQLYDFYFLPNRNQEKLF